MEYSAGLNIASAGAFCNRCSRSIPMKSMLGRFRDFRLSKSRGLSSGAEVKLTVRKLGPGLRMVGRRGLFRGRRARRHRSLSRAAREGPPRCALRPARRRHPRRRGRRRCSGRGSRKSSLNPIHQPRGLSRRQQPGSKGLAFHNENRRARRAARRGAEAAGDVVETNFGALALGPVLVGARAPVDRADRSSAQGHRARHLPAIERRHQFDEILGVGRRVPLHSGRNVFEEVRKRRCSRSGQSDIPPNPVPFRLRGHAGMSVI